MSTLKIMKSFAVSRGYTFKRCKATFNSSIVYAFFNEFNECVSVKASLKNWRDILENGDLQNKTGFYGMGYY